MEIECKTLLWQRTHLLLGLDYHGYLDSSVQPDIQHRPRCQSKSQEDMLLVQKSPLNTGTRLDSYFSSFFHKCLLDMQLFHFWQHYS